MKGEDTVTEEQNDDGYDDFDSLDDTWRRLDNGEVYTKGLDGEWYPEDEDFDEVYPRG